MNPILVVALLAASVLGVPQGMGTDGMGTGGTNGLINPAELGHWCQVYDADPVMWDMPFGGDGMVDPSAMFPTFSPEGMIYPQDLGAWCQIYNQDPEMWDHGYGMGTYGGMGTHGMGTFNA